MKTKNYFILVAAGGAIGAVIGGCFDYKWGEAFNFVAGECLALTLAYMCIKQNGFIP